MLKKKITVLAFAGMLALASAPPAWASSGTLHCGSGGDPITSRQGTQNFRTHALQGESNRFSDANYEIWPFTVGSRAWSVTPSPGSGACII